jgi:hypothetical protein
MPATGPTTRRRTRYEHPKVLGLGPDLKPRVLQPPVDLSVRLSVTRVRWSARISSSVRPPANPSISLYVRPAVRPAAHPQALFQFAQPFSGWPIRLRVIRQSVCCAAGQDFTVCRGVGQDLTVCRGAGQGFTVCRGARQDFTVCRGAGQDFTVCRGAGQDFTDGDQADVRTLRMSGLKNFPWNRRQDVPPVFRDVLRGSALRADRQVRRQSDVCKDCTAPFSTVWHLA